jgi:ATP-dependent RNA helicase DeaD
MTDTIDSFAALKLPPALLSALTDVGYETPSPIQAACIPILLEGRDLLGEAQTGTGKTAAFALPVLARIDLALKKPQALVLAPTRELAIQVAEAFQKYARHMPGFHVLPVYGGQSMVIQLRALSRGAHVIVGTPGRVMDHLERKSLNLDALQTLILDEADEMLRMGFIDDVEWILGNTPATRQTALFSATMPEPIRRITKRYQRDPQQIKIKTATATVSTIRQRYWQVRGADKLDALTRMLEVEDDFDAAIIFVRTKLATVDLAEKLEARGMEAAALNGDMTQGLREQVIERLKNGSLDIVVATDVAARGLDVQRVSHVINYDVPYDTEAYIHRIGRTGRAGRTGSAILFVAPREMRMLKAIETATRQKIEPISLPTAGEVAEKRVAQFQQQILEVLGNENLDFFYDIIRRMEGEQNIATRQIAAALAFLAQKERPLKPDIPDVPAPPPAPSFTASPRESRDEKPYRESRDEKPYRESRDERPPRESRDEKPRQNRAPAGIPSGHAKADFGNDTGPKPTVADGSLRRYRIDVGRNLGATPKEIVGAIANEGGIAGKFIGQIHLFADFSTVELPELPPDVMATLKKTRVKQTPLNIKPFDPDGTDTRPARPERSERVERPARPAFSERPPRSERPERADRPASPAKPGFGAKPPFKGKRTDTLHAATPRKPRKP